MINLNNINQVLESPCDETMVEADRKAREEHQQSRSQANRSMAEVLMPMKWRTSSKEERTKIRALMPSDLKKTQDVVQQVQNLTGWNSEDSSAVIDYLLLGGSGVQIAPKNPNAILFGKNNSVAQKKKPMKRPREAEVVVKKRQKRGPAVKAVKKVKHQAPDVQNVSNQELTVRAGAKVVIEGNKKSKYYGEIGLVKKEFQPGTAVFEVELGVNDGLQFFRVENLRAVPNDYGLDLHTRAEIFGLKNSPQWNGKEVVVVAKIDANKCRIRRLDNGKVHNASTKNLKPLKSDAQNVTAPILTKAPAQPPLKNKKDPTLQKKTRDQKLLDNLMI